MPSLFNTLLMKWCTRLNLWNLLDCPFCERYNGDFDYDEDENEHMNEDMRVVETDFETKFLEVAVLKMAELLQVVTAIK